MRQHPRGPWPSGLRKSDHVIPTYLGIGDLLRQSKCLWEASECVSESVSQSVSTQVSDCELVHDSLRSIKIVLLCRIPIGIKAVMVQMP